MEQGNSRLFLLIIYFALAVYLLPMFLQGNSGNELSRWATTVSLVENTSFELSPLEKLIGQNADVVKVGERSYSKNPPGVAVLSAPFYALTRIFIGEPNTKNLKISWFILRFCIGTLPLLFLAIWLVQKDTDTFSLATLLFATPLFVYSLLYFSHVLVAVLVYFIFRLLFDVERVGLRDCFRAGFLSGFTVICEFPALIPILIFLLGLFFTEHHNRSRRVFFFLVGLLPLPGLLFLYNYAIFGHAIPAFYLAEFSFYFPTPYNIFITLFSPSRGLFFYSPILIFSIFAFFTTREAGTLRKRVKISAIVLTLLIMCGFNAAKTDWMFAGKHVIFILPLMLDSFFDGETEEYPSLWRGYLFTVSLLLCTIPALTFPFASPELAFPHNTFWQPAIFESLWFVPNLAMVFGAAADNAWTIVPAIALLLFVIYFVWRWAKYPLAFAIGILSAFLAVGIYMFVPTFDSQNTQQKRETIIKIYR